jgi:glucose 1-dehydrogenase
MKAVAVFPDSREVKLIEQEEPIITQPDQVKLRMLDIGICGTDKEICTFAYGTPPAGADYLVIGHEALGEVVEAGAAVTYLAPGAAPVALVTRTSAKPAILPNAASKGLMVI